LLDTTLTGFFNGNEIVGVLFFHLTRVTA
jgi:hypothetical protein